MAKTYYIFWKGPEGIQVVDEADSEKEAKDFVQNYRMAFHETPPEIWWGTNREKGLKGIRDGNQ